MKTVKCINNVGLELLSVGGKYDVIKENGKLYRLKTNNGLIMECYKWRFEEVESEDSALLPSKKLVKCTDNDDYGKGLTVGCIYEVVDEDNWSYHIINNSGDLAFAKKYRFIDYVDDYKEEVTVPNVAPNLCMIVNDKSRTYHIPTKFGMKEVTIEGVREVCVSPNGIHHLKTADGRHEIIPDGWVRISIEG